MIILQKKKEREREKNSLLLNQSVKKKEKKSFAINIQKDNIQSNHKICVGFFQREIGVGVLFLENILTNVYFFFISSFYLI